MLNKSLLCLILSVISISSFAAVSPTLRKTGVSEWEIAFKMDRFTDVAVSIVNIKDSTVVRHIGAGVLGPKAPTPFVKDSLNQVIVWDGKDNFGKTVTIPDADLRVRVRAGLSVSLDALVGDNPYAFYYNSAISGIVTGKDGSIFICGMPEYVHNEHYTEISGDYKVVRQYDKEGNYLRTVFPFPSNLPASDVAGWGVINKNDGSYSPYYQWTSIPAFSKTNLGPHPVGSRLLGVDDNGRLIFGRQNRSLWLYDSIFSFGPDGRLPVLQNTYYGKRWSEAVDASGRVYVCDTTNNCINVYSAANALIGTIPVTRPDMVAVSKKTGNVYMTGKVLTGTSFAMWLYKFAPYDNGAAKVCSVSIGYTISTSTSGNYGKLTMRTSLTVNDSNSNPWVWVGGGNTITVLAYEDAGTSFVVKKNFFQESQNRPNAHVRIAVDRRNETVYLSDNTLPGTIHKIENWSNPKIVRCSTSTGQAMTGWDVVISPDNMLYVPQNRTGGDWGPYVRRFTLDHKHSPVNYSNIPVNSTDYYNAFYRNSFIRRGEAAANGFSDYRGFTVGYDGRVALIRNGLIDRVGIPAGASYAGGAKCYHATVFDGDTAITDTSNCGKIQVAPIWFSLGDPGGAKRGSCGGIKFDIHGNLYIGSLTRTTDQQIPNYFTSNKAYTYTVGSVIRYGKSDSGAVVNSINSLAPAVATTGNAKVYSSAGIGPFSCDPGTSSHCVCGSPRFDVDPYGRLFLPNAVANHVSIVDNNDNLLLQFGKYGNVDSRGGLSGPGVPIATPEIPLGFPVSVAASEDYVYVADMANGRVVRVKMNYAEDNLPNLTNQHVGAMDISDKNVIHCNFTTSPVPFSANSSITFSLSAKARALLEVYDVRGTLIKKITDSEYGRGVYNFKWNGSDSKGRSVAAGIYLFKLTLPNRVMINRTILAR
ncbi:MAG: hypothetical protein JNL74_16440 [Fibrobacteres bacterium]|nr:hypothetical protein [Fibrobacterota bacterium]